MNIIFGQLSRLDMFVENHDMINVPNGIYYDMNQLLVYEKAVIGVFVGGLPMHVYGAVW